MKKTRNDKGFTLIELLVVILIIAILAAVGIVALLGSIRAGQDSAAKQTLATVNKEMRAIEASGEQTDQMTLAEGAVLMNKESPDLTWQTTAITGDPTNVVTISQIDPANTPFQFAIFGVRSKSGKCAYTFLNPLANQSQSGIPKSAITMIAKEKSDSCSMVPTLNGAGTGPNLALYDVS
jgi:prepilin-type N-terminal cleavage/methylation domain-containing protein